MKNSSPLMVTGLFVCVLLGGIVSAQERTEDKNTRRVDQQVLTEGQKTDAKNILSKYNPAKLSAEDAKAIHKAVRDMGIPGGRAMNELLTSVGFDPDVLRKLDPPPQRRDDNGRGENKDGKMKDVSKKETGGEGSKYSIEQAISDNAQLHTIAFSGLAFLTGDFGAATFIPPWKSVRFLWIPVHARY